MFPFLILLVNFVTWLRYFKESCLFSKGVFLCDENHWHPLSCKLKTRLALYYRPPTKLTEGNVFSRVCTSVILSTGPAPASLYRSPLLVQGIGSSLPCTGPYPHPIPFQKCSNLFNLHLTVQGTLTISNYILTTFCSQKKNTS